MAQENHEMLKYVPVGRHK